MDFKKIVRNKKIRFKIISLFKFVPDKPMLKFQYKMKLGRKLNLDKPTRYTEKLQWYKLFYRNDLMPICADKYTVRKYLEEKEMGYLLNDLYEVFESPEDISFENLPNEFVLKLSNGSSTNFVCKNKNEYNVNDIQKKFKDYIAQANTAAGREWVYGCNKPVIVAEKLLIDKNQENGELVDYKILCFNGKPEYIICVSGRYTDHYNHVVYDTNWNKQDVMIGNTSKDWEYPRPEKFDEMLNIAEELSKDFPHARIDLYSLESKLIFGEITFFPWSGYMTFSPEKFDDILGDKFVLPEKRVE